jgi:translocator protein
MLSKLKSFRAMRWLTLVLQAVSALFSYLAGAFNIGQPLDIITDQYDSLFRPAGYTFAIWGVIYIALITYCVYQLLPSQLDHLAYERINKYVRLNAILNIAWIFCFRNNWIPASAIVLFPMLIACIIMFSRAHFIHNRRNFSLWVTVPFSLYLAWISIAFVANISLWLRYKDVWWNGADISPEMWVVIMLAILLLITQSIANNFRDFVFPLVVCWGSIGIWVALKNNDVLSSKASLGAGVIAFIIAIVAAYKRKKLMTHTIAIH